MNRIRLEVTGDSDDLQAALARSRESIKGVGDESDRQTTRAGRLFDRLRAKLAKPISAKVEADTAAADARLNDLGARIKALDKAKASMTVDADVAKAESKLRALRAEMSRTAAAANIRAQARVDVQGLGMLELDCERVVLFDGSAFDDPERAELDTMIVTAVTFFMRRDDRRKWLIAGLNDAPPDWPAPG